MNMVVVPPCLGMACAYVIVWVWLCCKYDWVWFVCVHCGRDMWVWLVRVWAWSVLGVGCTLLVSVFTFVQRAFISMSKGFCLVQSDTA